MSITSFPSASALKKNGAIIGLFYLFAVGAFASEAMLLAMPEIKTPLKIDGALDDLAWRNATKIALNAKAASAEGGTPYSLNAAPSVGTTAYLVRDKKWLYLGFECDNPNMASVTQTAFKHDDYYPISRSDSMEILIKPNAAKDPYYWFLLSFANVTCERRVTAVGTNVGWAAPWRSATGRVPNGWTAEVAIPLFSLAENDLRGAKINIARDLAAITLDPMGAKQAERTVFYALTPCDRSSFHDPNNFVAVSGLGGFKPEIPFAPKIAAARVTGPRLRDGKYFYDAEIALERYTSVAGETRARLVESTGGKDIEKASATVELFAGKRELVLSAPLEMDDSLEREIRVELTDPTDGSALAVKTIDDTSVLRVIRKAFVGRDYYTSEKNVDIRMELGLPVAMLKDAILAIDVNGRNVSETKGLAPIMTMAVPLSEFKIGDNVLRVRFMLAGKELAAQNLTARRLTPRPGFEVKTDLIRGAVIKNERPIFPVGIYVDNWRPDFPIWGDKDDPEALFGFLKDIGFTTLVNAHVGMIDKRQLELADTFAKLADKHGMDAIEWIVPLEPKIAKATSPAERLAIAEKWWRDQVAPAVSEETKILRERPNLLAYYNVDEPNLGDAEIRIAVAERYFHAVRAIDPYRPLFLLYSMSIPADDKWTNWGQILGFDIYPRPFTGRIFSEPGLYTAYYAYVLRERCRQDHKIMWFAPSANCLDLHRTPIALSKDHMRCQAYTAIVYGARGLLYFTLTSVVGEDAWDALRTISAEIREMTPALTNGDVPQRVRYAPDNFNPLEQKFPMVNVAAFQYPDGAYLLLAVNVMPFAVDTKFRIGGAQSGARLFNDNEKNAFGDWLSGVFGSADGLRIEDETFADKLEGYGVRAYKIELADNPTPIQIVVDMKALENEKAPSVDVAGIVRRVTFGKNHMPNPCFRGQFNKGVPDFFLPLSYARLDFDGGKPGSSWYLDDREPWNGVPSLCVTYSKTQTPWQMAGACYPSVGNKPSRMVFSFYAKGAKAGDSVSVHLPFAKGGENRFALTTEWKRYYVSGGPRPYGPSEWRDFNNRPIYRLFIEPRPPASTVWISGLQLENGETPTEFQDDSLDGKK